MKTRFRILILILGFVANAYAQTMSIQPAVDACLDMREAMESGSDILLKDAADRLEAAQTKPFNLLRQVGAPLSLDGHYIFDVAFARDLIANRQVFEFAQRYSDDAQMGSASKQGIFLKNVAVSKGKSAKFKLVSRGQQELAVIAEPNGLLTMRIADNANQRYYNDTDDVAKGRPYRALSIDLGSERPITLEIEIINTGNSDTSFAIIGN